MTSVAAQSEQISAGGSEQGLALLCGRRTPPLHSTSQRLGTSLLNAQKSSRGRGKRLACAEKLRAITKREPTTIRVVTDDLVENNRDVRPLMCYVTGEKIRLFRFVTKANPRYLPFDTVRISEKHHVERERDAFVNKLDYSDVIRSERLMTSSLVCMGRHAMPCRILLNSSAAAKSDGDSAHPIARNFEIGLPSLCNVTNNDGLSLIQKRFPAGLAQFFIGYSIMDVWMMFETIKKIPTSLRASGKTTSIRKRSCKGPCAIIEEDNYIVCFIQVEDDRWQSRGATVAQSRFRGMSLMRLLIQSRGCGGVGLRQATRSNEDEDEDEEE
ncbi:hypothetical protein ALC57_09385 [Trachymyrmex cornetzi]|uniref:Uncharacterized protein n=1 Tax=Trachymyrmex cornetzi TaxID=471704 RepID=A0A195DZH7_9HYME|nr:hypothetical protein ALC57_09385 [Trachymyrmex cornetzi]